ncbi:helix-turn-helix domain-containing protein [Leptolyngbya sp. FACHB-711]|uniref:helix-turn-helix domain-containing protein n=1 Tax=Leptolyngbya sp. FACHB-711 TaxID=2692813 RepID=UPI0032202CF7
MKIKLKEVRESRGLSQNRLAQACDMTLQNIQKIEYGKAKSLTLDALDKLCTALQCQPGDLLKYEVEQPEPIVPAPETGQPIATSPRDQNSEPSAKSSAVEPTLTLKEAWELAQSRGYQLSLTSFKSANGLEWVGLKNTKGVLGKRKSGEKCYVDLWEKSGSPA